MWITTDNDHLVSFKDQNMEAAIRFSATNKAQCPDEVGAYLVEKYPNFHGPDSEAEDDDADDGEAVDSE